MNQDFQKTVDRACDTIEALRSVLAYPLEDYERFLDLRLQIYSEEVFKENSPFHGDRARESLNKVLHALIAYLRDPSGDNYLWVNNALSDHRYSLRAHIEVTDE